jgi:large subunit ribosomal protein L30
VKSHLHVKQMRSLIGQAETMHVTVKALGLRGPGTEVTVANTPSFRGAIKKVLHLVAVEEVDGKGPATKASPKAAATKAR